MTYSQTDMDVYGEWVDAAGKLAFPSIAIWLTNIYVAQIRWLKRATGSSVRMLVRRHNQHQGRMILENMQ
jgi:hypothetical protein